MKSGPQPSTRRVRRPDALDDAVSSVVRYARQETIDPLRGAWRWLAFGLVGAVLVGLSTIMFVVGVLRLVQDVSGTALDGSWSFVPYVTSFLVAVAVTVLAVARIGGSELNKRAVEEGRSRG